MKILLRKVENASVALFTDDVLASTEMLPTRYDLFQYTGGVAWGYKGTGVQNLGYAIAAKLADDIPGLSVHGAAKSLVLNLLSHLDEKMEYTLDHNTLVNALTDV